VFLVGPCTLLFPLLFWGLFSLVFDHTPHTVFLWHALPSADIFPPRPLSLFSLLVFSVVTEFIVSSKISASGPYQQFFSPGQSYCCPFMAMVGSSSLPPISCDFPRDTRLDLLLFFCTTKSLSDCDLSSPGFMDFEKTKSELRWDYLLPLVQTGTFTPFPCHQQPGGFAAIRLFLMRSPTPASLTLDPVLPAFFSPPLLCAVQSSRVFSGDFSS